MLYLVLTQTKKTWLHLFKHQKYNQLLSELFLYAHPDIFLHRSVFLVESTENSN